MCILYAAKSGLIFSATVKRKKKKKDAVNKQKKRLCCIVREVKCVFKLIKGLVQAN